MIRFFILMGGLLSAISLGSSTFGQAMSPSPDELGDTRLLREWSDHRQNPETRQPFMKLRFFEGVAEDYWVARATKTEFQNEYPELENSLSSLRLFPSLEALRASARSWATHPFRSFSQINTALFSLLMSFGVALLVGSFFSLGFWSASIRQDLLNRFRISTGSLPYFLLIIGLFGAVIWSAWTSLLLLAIGLKILYSRQKKFFITVGLVVCLLHTTWPLLQFSFQSAERMTAVEALDSGRTRLSYSTASLENLLPWERALWSFWNGAEPQARSHLKNADSSWKSQILQAHLELSLTQAHELRDRYRQVLSEHPSNPLLQYNLIQIYTWLQDLVAADELRAKMSPEDLHQMAERAKWRGDRLAYPFPSGLTKRFLADWTDISSEWFRSNIKFSLAALLGLISVLIPWLIFGLAVFLRNSVSGLCRETGTATASPAHDFSGLAIKAIQKSENLDQSQRQRYTQLKRLCSLHVQKWNDLGMLFFPGTRSLLAERYVLAFTQAASCYLLIWLSLPSGLRTSVQKSIFDPGLLPPILPEGMSWLLLVLGLALWALIFWTSKKEFEG